MITAKEAAKISESLENDNMRAFLEKVDKLVRAAANNGKRAVYLDKFYSLASAEAKELIRLGYEVQPISDQRDNLEDTIVSW